MALLTVGQFVASRNGKQVDMDGGFPKVNPYQCWDLGEDYARNVLGIPANPYALPTGDGTAYSSFNEFDNLPKLQAHFTKVVRSHRLIKLTPKYGDLVFWSRLNPGSEGAGHVDICLANGSSHNFTGFDQNWRGPYAYREVHNYDYVVGFLRPKQQPK